MSLGRIAEVAFLRFNINFQRVRLSRTKLFYWVLLRVAQTGLHEIGLAVGFLAEQTVLQIAFASALCHDGNLHAVAHDAIGIF